MKRYTRRKSYKVKILFSLLFLIILCMMAGKVLNSDFTLLPLDNITHHVASEDNGWNLILVNRNSYIPDDYKVELTELSNGEKVDSRIYPELQEMFNDARAQGYGLFVREGYRTQEEQQQLLDEKIEAYENEGKSKSEAKKLAEQWVAIPGTSEHQLGIAVDINIPKLCGQHLLGHMTDGFFQFPKALGSGHQVSQNQNFPFVTD